MVTPNYEEDASSLDTLSTEKVEQVGTLAKEIQTREAKILALESELEIEEKALNRVQGGVLPELLAELGITSLKLKDGSELEIKDFYAAHISEERKQLAHDWLEENGFGSLIKKEVLVAIDRKDKVALADLEKILHTNGYEFSIAEGVHFKTLESFVKGQLESTDENVIRPPFDLFGIFVAKKALIRGKTKQAKRKYKKK